ncbi:MAG: hypothetical protein ACREQV_22595 [Candidatus Binatia bacterium]
MADLIQRAKTPTVSPVEGVETEKSNTSEAHKKWTLKGMLMMAACCALPLLLLAAIPFLGLTLGSYAAVGSGLLSILALLACPVGMFFMMRMMMKNNGKNKE